MQLWFKIQISNVNAPWIDYEGLPASLAVYSYALHGAVADVLDLTFTIWRPWCKESSYTPLNMHGELEYQFISMHGVSVCVGALFG